MDDGPMVSVRAYKVGLEGGPYADVHCRDGQWRIGYTAPFPAPGLSFVSSKRALKAAREVVTALSAYETDLQRARWNLETALDRIAADV